MAFVIERKKEKPKKSAEAQIEELKLELATKEGQLADLQSQVELMQEAVDEIIFGGAF